ncbi:MAG: gamma-glutamyl-gamma-aminobutyrate hydrolase family protein [Actinomycetales bacterium]|nr:gamma-glutamyl-gamma-aminobutyrate hydrolase family protein [Actinomycetales bacterium]
MRVLVVSHRGIAHELGHLQPWLQSVASGGLRRAYREDGFSGLDLDAADLLVVLGSPGSVATGHRTAPALAELALVRSWALADRPYLGICFGAQVLACALGGNVRRMPGTYRALAPVPLEAEAPSALAGPWLTWHEDAITRPAGATVLARADHADLAFRQGRAWGLQPHIEVSAASLERMLSTLGVPEDQFRPYVEEMALQERGDDPPAARVDRLLAAFAEEALGR